jgi:hypothetical protein
MGIKINVGGLDDVQKFLGDFQKGLERQSLDEWEDRIIKTAKELCNDPDCKRIRRLERQEQEEQQQNSGKPVLNVEFTDKEAIDCMLRAIDKLLSSMPPSLQLIYEESKPHLEAKKAEFTKLSQDYSEGDSTNSK